MQQPTEKPPKEIISVTTSHTYTTSELDLYSISGLITTANCDTKSATTELLFPEVCILPTIHGKVRMTTLNHASKYKPENACRRMEGSTPQSV